MKLFVYLFVVILNISITPALAKTKILSEDIIITGFSKIELKQGQSKVKPIFKIKNIGSKKYQNIYLKVKPPAATIDNQVVTLDDSGSYEKISLRPGEEVDYFPGYYFSAKVDQPMVDYALTYEVAFSDEGNRQYLTSKKTIMSYASVVHYNSDIVLMDYKTTELQQGQSNTKPIFTLKNVGLKPYKKISVKTHPPEALINNKKFSLKETGGYQTINLNPGEEAKFFSGYYLSAETSQPKGSYAMDYYLSYEDGDGHGYVTPKKHIENYAKVSSFNNDIIVTRYSTTILKQGEANVNPVFQLKNVGNKEYKEISVKTQAPQMALGDEFEQLKEVGNYKTVSLKPGEVVEFSPGVALTAEVKQPKGNYSSSYALTFMDKNGNQFLTPPFKINRYAMVIGKDEDQKLLGGYDSLPIRPSKTLTDMPAESRQLDSNKSALDRLKKEVEQLDDNISPAKLLELKKLIKQLEKDE